LPLRSHSLRRRKKLALALRVRLAPGGGCMNILERMNFLNSHRANLDLDCELARRIDREFTKDFATVVSAYNEQFYPGSETPMRDLETDPELGRINDKWARHFFGDPGPAIDE
jgi:hypothetical protein